MNRIQNDSRMQAGEWLSALMLLFLSFWCISPPLFINGPCRIAALLFAFLFLLMMFAGTQTSSQWKLLFCVGLYLGMRIISNQNGDFQSFILNNIQTLILLLFSVLCFFFLERGCIGKKLEFIFWAILFIYPVWMLLTLHEYATNPYISRMLAGNGTVDVYEYSSQGIGGYGTIYSVVLFIPLLLFALRNRRLFSRAQNLLILINLILSVLLVLRAGYTLALIALIAGVVSMASVRRKSVGTAIVLFLSFTLLVLLYLFFQDSINTFLTRVSQNTLYQNKVKDITRLLVTGDSVGSVQSRTLRYSYSLQVFLQYPLAGCGNDTMTGGHSAILDLLASCGLIGGFPFLAAILGPPLRYLRDEPRFFGISVTMLLVMVLIGATDNYAAAMAPVFFLLYPVLLETVRRRSRMPPAKT